MNKLDLKIGCEYRYELYQGYEYTVCKITDITKVGDISVYQFIIYNKNGNGKDPLYISTLDAEIFKPLLKDKLNYLINES